MTISDNLGCEVIRLIRPLRCWTTTCRLQSLEVQSPPGTTIGYVIQNWSLCRPTFTIQNENNQDVFRVTRTMGLCSPLSFKVKTVEQRSEVGMINMRFLRLGMCTYNKDYEIQFPLDLDVKLKALLLSTGLLFDFLFYQRNG
ncbi:Hypothetical predicted protein [Pelobates cultripes]|uniref:Phospholipid scramblase n=1 Tax=Pelobates cultripes TaxID=61616 RepID=A0AAD1VUI4_PELCU|nr:Hypothetical predicted protein [Pelobates cultripes]